MLIDFNWLAIGKSGFLFVYLSNETSGRNMFFDNLTIQHYTGPMPTAWQALVEETQYYPFGLAMAGVSSRAVGKMENKKKFNGYEENKTFDLNWLESFYRTYDPQLGRFWQVDPKANEFESLYAGMGNNPVLKADPLGDTVWVYGQQNQNDFLNALSDVFGKDNFKFTDNGALTFTGDINKFSKSDKKILNPFLDNMVNSTNKISFKSNELTESEKLIADEHGGRVTVITPKAEQALILINKNNKSQVPLWERSYTYLEDGKLVTNNRMPEKGQYYEGFSQKKDKNEQLVFVPFSLTARIFHEIGHVIYEGQKQSKVNKYENAVREKLNIAPLRAEVDATHSN